MDNSCEHVWSWKEKNYQNGYPLELEVWCEKCGEKRQLVKVGPVVNDKLDSESSPASEWKDWLRKFREKYGVNYEEDDPFSTEYITVGNEEHIIKSYENKDLWVIEIHIDNKLVSREVVEQKENPRYTHYDVVPDVECSSWFGKRKDKKEK